MSELIFSPVVGHKNVREVEDDFHFASIFYYFGWIFLPDHATLFFLILRGPERMIIRNKEVMMITYTNKEPLLSSHTITISNVYQSMTLAAAWAQHFWQALLSGCK